MLQQKPLQQNAARGRPADRLSWSTGMMKRILLMDDSELFIELTRAALQAAGYEVVCASDLAQLADARKQASDLVLMDVQMPEAFGDDVALTLRHVYGITAPIYLLSSLEER